MDNFVSVCFLGSSWMHYFQGVGMKYIELFSGLGGMGYGLMKAGMECVGYCEIDKYAHKAFQILHDPEERMWNAYDVRGVTDDDIRLLGRERGPIQLIAAGFPCQSFSVIGNRRGFEDTTRGTLFFDIIRFASILKPRFILLENVRGLLSHEKGKTFETVISTLDELGYVGQWQVIDSRDFGIPHQRKRIFIVAVLGGFPGTPILPIREKVRHIEGADGEGARNFINNIDASYFKGVDKHAQRTLILENYTLFPDEYETCECCEEVLCKRCDAHFYECDCLGVSSDLLDGRLRMLTPLEAFRLQSFPDEWYYKLKEHGISDTQLYKMAGNAVTSAVTHEIGKRIKALD